MPADMNDYFKKKKPSGSNNNGGGGSNFENPLNNMPKGLPTWLIVVGIILFAVMFLRPFTIINEGEVGIKVNMGKFQEDPLRAGFHILIPVIQEIIPVSIKTRQIVYSNTQSQYIGDRQSKSLTGQNYGSDIKRASAITVKDKRNLKVDIDISVQYRLKAKSAPATIANFGMSWEENLINPTVRSVVRDVLGQYIAEETAENRKEINDKIKSMIEKSINAHEGQPVKLVAVDLRNINLPENVQNSINDVQMAEQQKRRATIDAKKRAEEAAGIAEKNRIEAQGAADKIRIEAEEQAKANKLISSSLTPELIQLEQIKVQGKFNEALKVNRDAQIFLTPGGAVPNIWVDAKGKQQQRLMGQE